MIAALDAEAPGCRVALFPERLSVQHLFYFLPWMRGLAIVAVSLLGISAEICAILSTTYSLYIIKYVPTTLELSMYIELTFLCSQILSQKRKFYVFKDLNNFLNANNFPGSFERYVPPPRPPLLHNSTIRLQKMGNSLWKPTHTFWHHRHSRHGSLCHRTARLSCTNSSQHLYQGTQYFFSASHIALDLLAINRGREAAETL